MKPFQFKEAAYYNDVNHHIDIALHIDKTAIVTIAPERASKRRFTYGLKEVNNSKLADEIIFTSKDGEVVDSCLRLTITSLGTTVRLTYSDNETVVDQVIKKTKAIKTKLHGTLEDFVGTHYS